MSKKFVMSTDFQTHPAVAEYMASLLDNPKSILEPTPGMGNLVNAARKKGPVVYPPGRFEDWIADFIEVTQNHKFDWVIMNPPFKPMALGVTWLLKMMEYSDNIICLLPWFIIINSEKRTKLLLDYGLVSVTHIPRKTFPGTRIQCCVMKLQKGYQGDTKFLNFSF